MLTLFGFRICRIVSCASIASALLSAASTTVLALTADQMQSIMDRKFCPSDRALYNDISYDQCKQGTNLGIAQCQNSVDKQNRIINKYNDWMRSCSRSK